MDKKSNLLPNEYEISMMAMNKEKANKLTGYIGNNIF
jgi:hypothetical protein